MARPLRIEFPGALYHVSARGNARAAVILEGKKQDLTPTVCYFDGPGEPVAVASIDPSIEVRDDRAGPIEGAAEICR